MTDDVGRIAFGDTSEWRESSVSMWREIASLRAENKRMKADLAACREVLGKCADWLERVDWEDSGDGPNNDEMNFMHGQALRDRGGEE